MSLCKDCVSGATHEGVPSGKIEEIAGVKTYVALPPEGTVYDKMKAVLFVADAFGIDLVNNQLLAYVFAKNGIQTYLPDHLNGDPVVELNASFDFPSWLAKHGTEQTRPPLDKVVDALKEKGVTSFGATGYCFGARYVFDLAFDGVIKAARRLSSFAPQGARGSGEVQGNWRAAAYQLLRETDLAYPAESQKLGDEILGGGKTETESYKRAYFPKCVHGFAVRGDLSIPEVKFGKGAILRECSGFKEKL
ncbi:hypothetical protein ACEPAI_3705 [Sanghuangporus weigelae]